MIASPDVAAGSLDGIGDACRRLLAGEGDAEIALTRYSVVHRVRSLAAIRGARLVGPGMHRRLAKRLEVKSLLVRVAGPTGVAVKATVSPFRAFARWA